MKPIAEQVLEWCGLTGFVGLAAFIPWVQFGLGAALTILAAFSLNDGHIEISTADEPPMKRKYSLGTALFRAVLLLAGVVLLVGAVSDGHRKYEANSGKLPVVNSEPKDDRITQEESATFQNGSWAESNHTDRTLVRAENNSSSKSNSLPVAGTRTPEAKWKFLHK